MTNTELQTKLTELHACTDAKKFCEDKTLQQAWDECTTPNWMLWLIYNAKTNATDKHLRLIAVKCARDVQHLMTDQRSLNALDVTERFANGEATQEELAAARNAAQDAARNAAQDAAGAAAWAAAWAAAQDAAGAVRAAAGDAAWAVRDAAWAAAGAAWAIRDAAGNAAWNAQCKIIRKFIPEIKILP
jgi:hypothetical protein